MLSGHASILTRTCYFCNDIVHRSILWFSIVPTATDSIFCLFKNINLQMKIKGLSTFKACNCSSDTLPKMFLGRLLWLQSYLNFSFSSLCLYRYYTLQNQVLNSVKVNSGKAKTLQYTSCKEKHWSWGPVDLPVRSVFKMMQNCTLGFCLLSIRFPCLRHSKS